MKQLNLSNKHYRILSVFFLEKKPFYVRELAKKLSWPASTISRLLNQLACWEILNFSIKGNLKIYSLNHFHPYLIDLQNLAIKQFGPTKLIQEVVNKTPNIVYSCIYGSAAKNKLTAASDIDLIIVGSPNIDRLNKSFNHLEKVLGREINYTFYSPEEFLSEKKKAGFLKRVLTQPIINIINVNRPFYEPENKIKKHYS
ncbi:MAG: nucleotidyltransferase domain-containing protein [Candidatus Beckwithbacteria bacterium]|nr:nucleotidyltransferase domain-containing protein [Candidatus Beckwithbacteria bacterium]